LRCLLDLALEDELNCDLRGCLSGSDAKLVYSADRRNCLFDRENALGDHLFRRGTRKSQADEDGGWIGLGEEVDAEIAKREDPEPDKKPDHHDREDRALDAYFSESHSFPCAAGFPACGRSPMEIVSTPDRPLIDSARRLESLRHIAIIEPLHPCR